MRDEEAKKFCRDWGPAAGVFCITLWQTAFGHKEIFTLERLLAFVSLLVGYGALYCVGLEIVRIASGTEKRESRVFRIAAGVAVNLIAIWLLNGQMN